MSGGGAEVMRSEAEEQVLGNLVGKRVIGSFSHQRRIPGFHAVNGLRKAREERGRGLGRLSQWYKTQKKDHTWMKVAELVRTGQVHGSA